jgi:HlyD family secretion protein
MDLKKGARGRWIIVGAAAVVVALALGWLGARGTRVQITPAATRELVQSVVATGRVMAPGKVQIGSVILGVVALVAAEEGQQVAQGAVLLQLDDREAHAAVAQARAGVVQAQVRVDQLLRVRAPLAAEEQRQAELLLTQAQAEFERLHEMLQKGAASRVQYDQAQTALDLARSRYQGALVQSAGLSTAGSDYRLAAAALAQAQAQLDAANARLGQSLISAPADGVVLSRSVEPGEVVQPGRVLLVIVRSGELRLSVPVDEKNLASLQVGQPALASAEAFAGDRFPAVVEQIAPAVDPQRGTVDVKLKVPAPPPYLRPDMTVAVEIEVGRRSAAVVVPAAAVIDANTGHPWLLRVRDGRVERRSVRLGLRGGGLLEIADGLQAGDRVVVEGQANVQPGQRVRTREVPGA